jgi:hypothetical protein
MIGAWLIILRRKAGLTVIEQHLGEANLARTEVYQECKGVRAPREKTKASPADPE